MNRKQIILLNIIGLLIIIILITMVNYNSVKVNKQLEKEKPDYSSISEVKSGLNKSKSSENTQESNASTVESEQTSSAEEYDANGDLVVDSKYLDSDGDTIANFYDACPGISDQSSECTGTTESTSTKYDSNGDEVSSSKYLDSDGDTVANYYDICKNGDDTVDKDGNGTPDACDW